MTDDASQPPKPSPESSGADSHESTPPIPPVGDPTVIRPVIPPVGDPTVIRPAMPAVDPEPVAQSPAPVPPVPTPPAPTPPAPAAKPPVAPVPGVVPPAPVPTAPEPPATTASGLPNPHGLPDIAVDRPEVAVGAAFGAGLVLALILKRLAR